MYLLDTNTVIDFCNSKLPLKCKELIINTEPFISFITEIELFASSKITKQEKLMLEDFVRLATTFDLVNNHLIDKTIEIRQTYRTKLPDALIAATAIVHNLTLITRNIKDFQGIEELMLLDSFKS